METLEGVLRAATSASLPLASDLRPAFIGKYLLASADGEVPTTTSGEWTQKPSKAELSELSQTLTAALNAAMAHPHQDRVRALAHELLKPRLSVQISKSHLASNFSDGASDVIAMNDPLKMSKVSLVSFASEDSSLGNPSPVRVGDPRFKKGLSFLAGRPDTGSLDTRALWGESEEELPPYAESPSKAAARTPEQRQSLRQSFRLSLSKTPELMKLGDDRDEHVRGVAKAAFELYDKDGSGFIDKYELFDCLMELGRVTPVAATEAAKLEYLEATFKLADTNGDGEVDYDEFVEFYAATLDDIAQEQVARARPSIRTPNPWPWPQPSLRPPPLAPGRPWPRGLASPLRSPTALPAPGGARGFRPLRHRPLEHAREARALQVPPRPRPGALTVPRPNRDTLEP